MKITVIYATGRKNISTTYNLAKKAIEELKENDDVFEFFLPRDMDKFCIGCYSCFEGHPERCEAYKQVNNIRKAMNESELIIFTAPVYVFHVPGQVKALLDHFAYEWMVHRVNGNMFKKQALIISTAAGAGMKSTIKDIKHSMDFWGVGRVYTYSSRVWRPSKPELDNEAKAKMNKGILKICKKINKKRSNVKPRFKVKLLFYLCRLMQKRIGESSIDARYWNEKGWLDKVRPW